MIEEIYNTRQALLYLTNCSLETVGEMAQLDKRRRIDYERHILIAQSALDLVLKFNIEIGTNTRIYEVVVFNNKSVKQWANSHEHD